MGAKILSFLGTIFAVISIFIMGIFGIKTDNQMATETFEKVLVAIENEDKNALKSLLSKLHCLRQRILINIEII